MIENNLNEDNYPLITTINQHEIYEKLRPIKKFKHFFQEYQAHGDDNQIQISKDQNKPFEKSMSSSSNEFSFEINEALKTDDENGMTKSYLHEKDLILSDASLQQQQQLINEECEYEIDLGNGYITKSNHKQSRTTSIISADSIQPITTFKIPFTNTVYRYPNEDISMNESNVLFNPQQEKSKFTFRTIKIFSIGITIIIFLIVIMFFVL